MTNTIISSDTTWLVGSQHDLTTTLQIASGVTLTIQPGAIVNGNGNKIQVFGTLSAAGSSGNLIQFNNTKIEGTNPVQPFSISLDHTSIAGGSFYEATGNALNGSFSLTDSALSNVTPIYVWYPVKNVLIQGNYFVTAHPGFGIRVAEPVLR